MKNQNAIPNGCLQLEMKSKREREREREREYCDWSVPVELSSTSRAWAKSSHHNTLLDWISFLGARVRRSYRAKAQSWQRRSKSPRTGWSHHWSQHLWRALIKHPRPPMRCIFIKELRTKSASKSASESERMCAKYAVSEQHEDESPKPKEVC